MRDSLTVLAILLIGLLTAALVGPYLVDFNAHRALIEAKLSRAAGTKIVIAGPIKIRLLPQPTFRLGEVTIGEAAPGQARLTVAELDVDIALTALMRGDLQVGETVLRSPRLDLPTAPDGAVMLKLPGLGDPSRVQFDHVVVEDGTLTLAQPGHPLLTLSGLDFYGEATSLIGPFKATGQFGRADDRQPFRLTTGTFQAGKLRVKLALDATKMLPSLDLDGMVSPGGGTPQKPVGPSLDGALTLKGTVPLAANPASIPWVLTGHVRVDRDKAELPALEFRAGTDLRAINATGTGLVALEPDPHASLTLHGPELDLDALAVAPDNAKVPPPKGTDLLAALNARLGQEGAPALPLRLDVAYGFETVTAGPVTLLGLSGHVGLDGGTAAKISLKAQGPDTAGVTLDGRFEGGAAPVFRGRLGVALRDVPRFAAWLGPVLPEAAARTLAAIPAHALSFEGDVDLSGVGIAARDAVLRLDQSQLKGTLTYTRAVGADRARLFADLSSDGVDLDDLPALGAGTGAWSDLDLDIAVAARAVKLVPSGFGTVDAGRIGLRLHKTGEKATLDSFSADLGTASLTATGTLDAGAATLDGHVDAPQLGPVAELLGRLFPGTPTAWLRDRALALSPTRVDLGLRATRAADGSLVPTALLLDGTANGSRIKADLKPDTPGDIDPETSVVSVDLAADAPEGLTLLRQLGLPAVSANTPLPTLGAGRLKGKAHGSAAEGFEASVDASLGGAVLSFQGRTRPDHGSGHLSLKGSDLAPVLRSAGIVPAAGAAELWPADAEADLAWHGGALAFRHLHGMVGATGFGGDLDAALSPPPSGAPEKPSLFGTLNVDRLSVPAMLDIVLGPTPHEGSGPWSAGPFGAPLLQWPRTEIALKAKTLRLREGLDIRDASLTLRADRRAVTLADLTGQVRSGNLGGSLTLRRDGPSASVTGTTSWSGIAVDWPGLAGRIGGTMDFGGSGTSPAALVANLAGTGSMTIAGGRIAKLDPAALTRTAVAAETNTSDVDADQIKALVVPDLDRAPLPLGDVSGQATLATGTLHVGPLRATTGEWIADADAAVDLKDFSFTSKTVLRVRQPLTDWKGELPQVTLLLDGPIDAPVREVDAAAFVNTLQSRAIARDQERIDILQQDIRERAFFNRRLKAIEADQAATRDKARAEAAASAAAIDLLHEMKQNQESARPPPLPLSRPTRLPGALSAPGGKANRSGTVKPAPGFLPDPASAGAY